VQIAEQKIPGVVASLVHCCAICCIIVIRRCRTVHRTRRVDNGLDLLFALCGKKVKTV